MGRRAERAVPLPQARNAALPGIRGSGAQCPLALYRGQNDAIGNGRNRHDRELRSARGAHQPWHTN